VLKYKIIHVAYKVVNLIYMQIMFTRSVSFLVS